MKTKKLTDFPEYVKANASFQEKQLEGVAIRDRMAEIEIKLTAVGENRVQRMGQRAELHQEFQRLEERQQYLGDEIEEARLELDRARGCASKEICEQVRHTFTEPIKQILDGLKIACNANDKLRSLRAELEAEGVRTGSICFCDIPELGPWDDEVAPGIASRYRILAKRNFGINA